MTESDVYDVAVAQLRRGEDLRADLVAQGVFAFEELSALRAEASERTGAVMRATHTTLVVSDRGDESLARIRFDDAGSQRSEVRNLIGVLLPSGMGPWARWTWMMSSTGLLSSEVPSDVARDPAQRHRVVTTARRTCGWLRGHP